MLVETYANWETRPSDQKEELNLKKKYFFICEGANTEKNYFEHLIDSRRDIRSKVDFGLWKKVEEAKSYSNPKKILDLVKKEREKPENNFNKKIDKIVMVFDGDIYERKPDDTYNDLIAEIEDNGIIAAVTNPCFELFLILHFEDSYEKYIKGQEKKFLKKDKNNKKGLAYQILQGLTNKNSKTNKNIGELAEKIQVAISQEKLINQDIHNIKGKVSSNVGKIIEAIIAESDFWKY